MHVDRERFDRAKEQLSEVVTSLPIGSETRHRLERILRLMEHMPVTPAVILTFKRELVADK